MLGINWMCINLNHNALFFLGNVRIIKGIIWKLLTHDITVTKRNYQIIHRSLSKTLIHFPIDHLYAQHLPNTLPWLLSVACTVLAFDTNPFGVDSHFKEVSDSLRQ